MCREAQISIQKSDLVSSGIEGFEQKPIHPALKKLIGKRPVQSLDDLTKDREKRKAAQSATLALSEVKLRVPKIEASKSSDIPQQGTSRDSQIAQLNSSRGRDQIKHVIVVGNTSQYIKEQSSAITHKWLCYVKTKSQVTVEKLVKKVRFHLDSSYKPNDVVEIDSPPFHLVRRGYGEFNMKLEIFFKNEFQAKPVQIFHQLMLDKKFSGHQTLSNETVTEFWTRNFLTDENVNGNSRQHLIDHDYFRVDGSGDSNSRELSSNFLLNREEVVQWINENFEKALNSSKSFINCHDNEVIVDEI